MALRSLKAWALELQKRLAKALGSETPALLVAEGSVIKAALAIDRAQSSQFEVKRLYVPAGNCFGLVPGTTTERGGT